MLCEIIDTTLPKVKIITPTIYKDSRGSFSKIFSLKKLNSLLNEKHIQEINLSYTQSKGTIRGIHYQEKPYQELKLVKVLKGAIFDVAVDLETGMHVSAILSDENNQIMVIPEGYGHGFQTLVDQVEMLYLHTEIYRPDFENGINPCDPHLNIPWPLAIRNCSERDQQLPLFSII